MHFFPLVPAHTLHTDLRGWGLGFACTHLSQKVCKAATNGAPLESQRGAGWNKTTKTIPHRAKTAAKQWEKKQKLWSNFKWSRIRTTLVTSRSGQIAVIQPGLEVRQRCRPARRCCCSRWGAEDTAERSGHDMPSQPDGEKKRTATFHPQCFSLF